MRTEAAVGVVGLESTGRNAGNTSRTGATVVATGLKVFGKFLGMVIPARTTTGAGASAGSTGLDATDRTLGNVVRTETAVGAVRLKPTGRNAGNISRTGVAMGEAGLKIFGKSLAKTVRAGVTVGTVWPKTAGRALGRITSAGAALGSLTRPLCKIVCAGGIRGDMVLAPPLLLRAVRTVAVLVGLSSGVGSSRATVDAVLSVMLFPT